MAIGRCRNSASLGDRLGSQTSYQFCAANCDLGTPRGGRRTVPNRRPSSRYLGVPNRTILTAIYRFSGESYRERGRSIAALKSGVIRVLRGCYGNRPRTATFKRYTISLAANAIPP